MPGGFLLDEDARSARLSEFDNWVEEQKKKAEDAAGAAQQTVQTTVAPVQAAVSQAPAAAQTAVQDAAQAVTQGPSEALQRFDAWVAQQQQAAAAQQQQAAATAPVATIPTPAPAPAPTDTTTVTTPSPAPEVSPLERFDTWAAQQKQAAQDAASGVGQAVGGAADAAGTAAQGALPHAEEPATATDQAPTAGAAVGGPDLGKNWKTQFDFGAVYTGDYRTGTPHRGVDLVPSNGKGIGTEVDAFAPGTVTNIFRDPGGAGGLIVYVQDADGLTHAYMHLAGTQPGLQVGTQVQRGTPIAMMGESGTEGSPHLHYEVRKNASNGDPLNQLIDPRVYVSGDKQPSGAPSTGGVAASGQQSVAPAATTTDQSTAPAPDRSMSFQDYARAAARRAGIDPNVFFAQIQQESGFNPNAKSPAGATGIAQFMPATAAGLKLDPTDAYASLDAAAQMDAQNLSKYKGDWSKALAAYNAGGGAVDQYGGVPPYKETQNYVQTIMANAQKAADAAGTAVSGAVGAAGQAVGGAASAVGTAASNAGKTALDAATSASGQVAQRAQDVMNQGKTQLQLLQDQTAQLQADFNALQDKLRAAQDAAAKQNEQYRSGLEQQVNQSRQDILAPRDFSGTLNAANQMGQDIMGSGAARAVGSAFDQAPSPLGGTLGSNVRDAQTAVQEAPSNLQNLGQGLQAANTEAQRQQNQDSVLTTAARTGLNLAGRDLSPQAAQALNTATPPMLQQAELGGAVSAFLKNGNVVPASQTVNLPFIGVTPVADIIGLAANLVTPIGAEERFAGSASQRALDRAAFEVAQRSQAGVGGMLERPGVQAAWASALGSKIGEGSTAARLAMSGVGRWARASVQEIASDLAQGPIARLVTDETGTLDVEKLTQIAQTVKNEMVRVSSDAAREDMRVPGGLADAATGATEPLPALSATEALAPPIPSSEESPAGGIRDFLTGTGSEAGSIGVGAGMRLGGGAAGLLGSENTMSPEDKQDPWGRFSRDVGATLLGAAAPGVVGALARGGGVNYRDLAAVRPGVGPPIARGPMTTAQAISAYTKQNLLSGLKGHVTNIASQLVELAHQPLSALASGREDDAVAGIKVSAQSVPDALRNFAKTLSTGETQFTQSQGATSKTLPALRLLAATDDFFRTIGWAMGAGQEGQRVLREGGATASTASSILGSNATRISEAGDKAGAMSVFSEGEGPGHAISAVKNRLLGSASGKDQLMGMLLDAGVPFSAVPGRIWRTGISRTPGVGEVLALRRARIALQAGDQKAFQKAMGDTAVQSVISASILSNVAKGNIRGPDDKEHPNGIKVNGQWYDYSSWGPWVLPIAIPAALYEAQTKEGNKPNPDLPKAWGNALGKTLANQFYAADIIKTLNQVGEGNLSGAAGSLALGYADRYLPASGLMNTATTLWDPILRDPANSGLQAIAEHFQSKVPGLESKLPATPNMLTGEPQQRTSSGPGQLIGMQTRPADKLATTVSALERQGYQIPDPTKVPTQVSLEDSTIPLTEAEGRALAAKRGQLIDRIVGSYVNSPGFDKLTDNQKAQGIASRLADINNDTAQNWAQMTPAADRAKRIAANRTFVGRLEPVGSGVGSATQ